jgi:hypothetical protein
MDDTIFDEMTVSDPQARYVQAPSIELPRNWDNYIDDIQEITTGKLPDEVAAEIKRQSAEKAATQGLGIGRTAQDLTLRDLGVSSYQQHLQGLALGLEAGKTEATLQAQQAEFNFNAQQATIAAQQAQQQVNQKWHATLLADALGKDQLAVTAANAYSTNRAARLDAEVQLLALSVQDDIDVQPYLDAIGGAGDRQGYFEPSEWVLGDVLNRQNIRI